MSKNELAEILGIKVSQIKYTTQPTHTIANIDNGALYINLHDHTILYSSHGWNNDTERLEYITKLAKRYFDYIVAEGIQHDVTK